MISHTKIGFIGIGAMGESILAGVLKSGLVSNEHIAVVGKGDKRAQKISELYSVQKYSSSLELVKDYDVICLSIKPKDLHNVSKDLKSADFKGKLIISTLAGVNCQTLCDAFPKSHVVRSIPNIASEICKSVTLWTQHESLPKNLTEFCYAFFSSVGQSIEVDSETYIDLASPISGAAPAFTGLFIEAMVDAGVFIGLPRDLSTQLVLQSLIGSCELINNCNGNAQLIRQRVTSPGGLTAVCIAKLESAGFRTALMDAIVAGKEKTEKLSHVQVTN